MNKSRREWLESIIGKLEEQKSEIEDVQSEEQDCFDNMPEGLQYSERGDTMQECIDDMDSAIHGLRLRPKYRKPKTV